MTELKKLQSRAIKVYKRLYLEDKESGLVRATVDFETF